MYNPRDMGSDADEKTINMLREEAKKALAAGMEASIKYNKAEAKLTEAQADRSANWERANSLAAENRELKAEVERLRRGVQKASRLLKKSTDWGMAEAVADFLAALQGGGE